MILQICDYREIQTFKKKNVMRRKQRSLFLDYSEWKKMTKQSADDKQ